MATNKEILMKFIYTRPDDHELGEGVSIVVAAAKHHLEQVLGKLTDEAYRAHVLERSIPEYAINMRPIEDSDFPESREFRNAWCDITPSSKVDIDLKKAKDIKLQHMRYYRDKKLEKLDKELMIASETGGDVEGIKTKKQALREATEPLKNLEVSGYNDEAVLQQIRELGTLHDSL
jgi:hypothetical protein